MDRKLTITGKGNIKVTPDVCLLSFDAEAHEWEYGPTITALNGKVEELRTIMESIGIDRKNLKTTDFRISKSTTWNKKADKHEFNGFNASHRLELEVPLEKDLMNALLGKIAKGKESVNFTIAFGVKDASSAQQQLILQALEKAKENAVLIAGATGVQLKEILHIDYSFRELVIRSERHDYPMYISEMAQETYEPTVDFEPEDISVGETVTITWKIE